MTSNRYWEQKYPSWGGFGLWMLRGFEVEMTDVIGVHIHRQYYHKDCQERFATALVAVLQRGFL